MKKTGELIAQPRKEKGLTQRELAGALHVSDRAVSKWERGAGFPDVSLLEGLAQALELKVLDLLRGERTGEEDAEDALKEAMAAFHHQRRRERKELLGYLGRFLLFLLPFIAFWLAAHPPAKKIDHIITAGVYEDGVLVSYTPVEIQGEVSLNVFNGERDYWGRFSIGCVEWTTREGMNGGLSLEGESGLGYTMNGLTTMELYDISTICSYDMKDFVFTLDGAHTDSWLILASSPQMYQEYYAGQSGVPPLQAPEGGWTPAFPPPWANG